MKIYTKTGDKGLTSLYGGKKVIKSNKRLFCYGTCDELNAIIGLSKNFITSSELHLDLSVIQSKLFIIGTMLATPSEDINKLEKFVLLDENDVEFLENKIDFYNEKLPELKNFILPGGSSGAGYLHLIRTVCRRCEREIVELSEMEQIDLIIVKYINRLSDYFFIAARYENLLCGKVEENWIALKRG